jgi:hypothetical protein
MRKLLSTVVLAAALAALPGLDPTASAGSPGGPAKAVAVAPSNGTRSYTRVFRAGEVAIVIVEGDGDSDLDLYVYDEDGNLVASDTDDTDFCVVRFTPERMQRFTIKVVNLGVANRFTIVSN